MSHLFNSRRAALRAIAAAGTLAIVTLSGGGQALYADESASAPAGDGQEARDLLARADSIRNPARDFGVTMSLVEYRGGKSVASSVLNVYAKLDGDSGQYSNLVRYVAPKRDNGKLVLRHGMDVWFYDPVSKASIRLSPQARLIGQASTGDVMSTSLSKAYSVSIVAHETVQDDAKKPRSCVKLHLTASHSGVPYAIVDYWVEEGSNRPVKAQYFTSEGRLLKHAYFRRYQSIAGHDHPTETVIVDGLDSSWITVIRESDLHTRDIPQTWFQRAYLPNLTWDE